jgi:hypothetical protein
MRVLEARFHPQKKTGAAIIVVGRVHCGRAHSWVGPAPMVGRSGIEAADARAMLEKLRFLVASSGPDPCEKLLTLASEFWSFVEIEELRVD